MSSGGVIDDRTLVDQSTSASTSSRRDAGFKFSHRFIISRWESDHDDRSCALALKASSSWAISTMERVLPMRPDV
jgi:hypothetical protein